MTEPAFTILLPVHRPPTLLPYAIDSVLAQERQDFELFVICDGAPPATAELARRYAADDPRIRVFEHPKGNRHGESYRDQALRQARGECVCQLGDDDLWLPNHLSEIAELLEKVDFGNVAQVEVLVDGSVILPAGDLADAATREAMMSRPWNFFGPTAAGYRLSAYRTLPVGWAPAPADLPTDLFMWRKFLGREGLRFGTKVAVTSIKFAAVRRTSWSLDQRRAEIESWAMRLLSPTERAAITERALLGLSRSAFIHRQRAESDAGRMRELQGALEASAAKLRELRRALEVSARKSETLSGKLQRMRRTWSWRLTRPFRKLARLVGWRTAG